MATLEVQADEMRAICEIIYTRDDTTARHLSGVLKMPLRRVQRRLKQLEKDDLVWKSRRGKTFIWRCTIPF